MPTLDIKQFEKPPQVGDTVTITGKVQEIKDGEVEISYDTVVALPGSSDDQATVSSDDALGDFMKNQSEEEDNVASQ